jgi:hypothetical protein
MCKAVRCPYQVVLPRLQLLDDSAILDFVLANVGWFDMYAEDDHAAFAMASKGRSMPRFSAPISIRNERLTLTR